MKQLTKEQAIAFAENKCYEGMTYRQIAEFQIEQDRLCMPFDIFHEAIEKTLGRPVFTHEFAFADGLRKELYGEKEPPTFEEICALIPKEKLMVIKL
jgi:hypothetical protein